MFLTDIFIKVRFWRKADRIGPDIPWTHWRLFFPKTMLKLCQKKFRSFGLSSEIRPGAYIVGCSQITIGANVVIRPGTMIHAETETLEHSVEIEDDVLIGCGVHIYVENHEFKDPNKSILYQGHDLAKKVTINEGAWIGANAVILPGVTIGKNSVVGASAVVTKNVPDFSVVVGNPARIIKTIEKK
ncbi:MAG: acetyltransferase-like isoleucine patch superfamily enzyme [Sediminicola sp.]|jgi:acetyltransferase-like isoleucine patch superfamily enzyme